MKNSIAIITDDILFSKLLESLIKKKVNNSSIITCQSLQEIDTMIVSTSCKLILLDSHLEGISSIEIIHYLRQKKHVLSPIWFFAEIQTDEYIYKSYDLGANRTIKKPFDPLVLILEIAALFSQQNK